jgi:hypothetical protein
MNANTVFANPAFLAVEKALASARDQAEPEMAIEFDRFLQLFCAEMHRVMMVDIFGPPTSN